MKQWSVRIPEEVLDWLREKAAKETIKRKKNVSMNTIAVEVFREAMERDKKEGGD